MGKGKQILRPELSDNAEFAVARNGGVEHSRDVALSVLRSTTVWVFVSTTVISDVGASRNRPGLG